MGPSTAPKTCLGVLLQYRGLVASSLCLLTAAAMEPPHNLSTEMGRHLSHAVER